jgi:predicted GNAT superfamily acetyltransferase
MTIRPITEMPDFEKCVALQRETWGWDDIDLLPARFLVVQHHIGGLLLGAFEGDRLVGFLNAVPGIRKGMPYWHSHMLAVARDQWNTGVGSDLKLAQRDYARKQGIRLIEWTFDPLESKNAYMNIEKLGVIIRRYYVNHYGQTTSELQKGVDSDRVMAEWWIDRPRPVLNRTSPDIRRIFIPADFQALKLQSLESACDVQRRVREQFLKNIEADYFVAGFDRSDEWSVYVFRPGASDVH